MEEKSLGLKIPDSLTIHGDQPKLIDWMINYLSTQVNIFFHIEKKGKYVVFFTKLQRSQYDLTCSLCKTTIEQKKEHTTRYP